MKRVIATPPGSKSQEIEIPSDERTIIQNEEQSWLVEKAKRDKREKRQAALAAKWPDAFDLLDDILERGIAPVKADRNSIKQANPKE